MSERTPLVRASPKVFSVLALVATCVVTCGLTLTLMNSRMNDGTYSFVAAASKKKEGNEGTWGERDHTLKLAKHTTFQGLVLDNLGHTVYEASGVRIVDDHYYVVYDNTFDIGKMDRDLPFLSGDNVLLTPEGTEKDSDKDSEFEGIAVDHQTNTFFVAQETVETKLKDKYHANISEIRMGSSSYQVTRACLTEMGFESSNKGIEGISHVRANNKEYLMGLCEGNHCQGGKKGRESGNGRIVVMVREGSDSGKCRWKTLQIMEIPKEAQFQDYSDIAIHAAENKKGLFHVAILSQENSQIWLGNLHIPQEKDGNQNVSSHHLDWSLTTKAVYDFPRDDEGKIIYCNVEGVDFFNHNLIVVVSDRMKGKGKQPMWCLDRDQSIHVFSLP